MSVLSHKTVSYGGYMFNFLVVDYRTSAVVVGHTPQTAIAGVAFHLDGGTAPTVSLGASTNTTAPAYQIPVTLTSGTFGRVMVITYHGESVGGSQ
jgi:hypothetical protein